MLPETIDLAVSLEWRLDHSYVIPLQYVRPELDLPVVPIHTNASLPPVPSVRRFVALGEHLRDSIERWESDARVAILTSGRAGLPRYHDAGRFVTAVIPPRPAKENRANSSIDVLPAEPSDIPRVVAFLRDEGSARR